MPRVGSTYDICTAGTHASATSTGTSNVRTITAPDTATAFFIACETNGIRFVLDGSTPDATNGLPLAAGAAPLFVPVGRSRTIRFVSQVAGNATAHVLFLE
jgi:hypothetical protein